MIDSYPTTIVGCVDIVALKETLIWQPNELLNK